MTNSHQTHTHTHSIDSVVFCFLPHLHTEKKHTNLPWRWYSHIDGCLLAGRWDERLSWGFGGRHLYTSTKPWKHKHTQSQDEVKQMLCKFTEADRKHTHKHRKKSLTFFQVRLRAVSQVLMTEFREVFTFMVEGTKRTGRGKSTLTTLTLSCDLKWISDWLPGFMHHLLPGQSTMLFSNTQVFKKFIFFI